jgi:hypothetical protein
MDSGLWERESYTGSITFIGAYILIIWRYTNLKLGLLITNKYKFGESIYTLKHSPSSIAKHLQRQLYNLNNKNYSKKVLITTSLVHEQLVTGSVSFLAKIFKEKLTCFITILYQLFSIIEQDKFRDLMLYSLPFL